MLFYALVRRLGVPVLLALLAAALVSFMPAVYSAVFHPDINERINGIVLFLTLHLLLFARAALRKLPSFIWGAVLFLPFLTALAAKEFGIAIAGALIVAAKFHPLFAPGNGDGPRVLRWPLVAAGVASLAAYFTTRLLLEDIMSLGPSYSFTFGRSNVARAFIQPFLPLFSTHG